jgi:hypothetical protein
MDRCRCKVGSARETEVIFAIRVADAYVISFIYLGRGFDGKQ